MQIPTRLPLVVSTSNRDSSDKKDARLVNCYIETDKATGELTIRKRPGLADQGNPPATTATGLGVYFWNGAIYSIFDSVLYKDGVSVATGLGVSGGLYSFSQLRGGNPKLLMQNGSAAYSYDDTAGLSANLHSINASYPEFTTPGWAYLGGAEYVMQNFFGTASTPATIWGSVVNSVDQPGDWDPLDFITAQIEPDSGVVLAKQLVYVIAIKQWSTEVFFDAGNPVGSPLAPVLGSKQSYGCVNADSLQRIDDVLFWASTNEAAQVQIVMMARLAITVISTPAIDRLLEKYTVSERTMYSWQIKVDGHSFYVLTAKGLNITLVYDITEGRWHQWTDHNGDYFPIVYSTYNEHGQHILQHESDGHLYYCSSSYFKDGPTEPIQLDIYTPPFDANTRRRKQCSNLEIVGDQQEGSLLQVRWTDDDYQTWTNFRTAHLGQKRPIMPDLGTFVKRAFNFRHTQDLPFRISAIELQYDLGTL
jgi:hypothetical protein